MRTPNRFSAASVLFLGSQWDSAHPSGATRVMSESLQVRQHAFLSIKRPRIRRALSTTRRALLEALREVEEAIHGLEALLHDRTTTALARADPSGSRTFAGKASRRRPLATTRYNASARGDFGRALSDVGRRMISERYHASGPPHNDVRRAFTADLVAFNNERGKHTLARTINSQPLTHYDTLRAMLRGGGLSAVIRRRELGHVCAQLDIPEADSTLVTQRLRVTYVTDLFHYEHVLVHGCMPDGDIVDEVSSTMRGRSKFIVD